MDTKSANEKLKKLIDEIKEEGSYLWEHGCTCILKDLEEILKLTEEKYYLAYLRAKSGAREEENLFYSYLIKAKDKAEAKEKLREQLKTEWHLDVSDYNFEEFDLIS